ncbi:hypothetical protein [Arthrobacter sp. STN4]|uniref:hypothetical protein n=1 Tax=Arthrobacter sp. STN4 TaxID=2923276 RepID=UPI00211A4A68|nr:hypothetical protein [Arthrobacter sp. STN4]MCQ9163945.1 hypothetical protein [Arthrobacter sp. STN4]
MTQKRGMGVGRVIPFGTGPAARRAASREADRLWQEGTAARAVFHPKYGGWAVLIFAGGVRHRPQDYSKVPTGLAVPGSTAPGTPRCAVQPFPARAVICGPGASLGEFGGDPSGNVGIAGASQTR